MKTQSTRRLVAAIGVVVVLSGACKAPAGTTAKAPAPGVSNITGGSTPGASGVVLPNADQTPGKAADASALNGTADKICAKGFSTKSVRPPVNVTNKIKTETMKAYGLDPSQAKSYELDHLISLTIGGDPQSVQNLWPEPWEKDAAHPDGVAAPGTGAQTKDKVENWLHKQVCDRKMTLEAAQQGEAHDWGQYRQQATGVADTSDDGN